MTDLQEIRRFWPKSKEFDVFGPLYVAKPFSATSFVIMECADGTYLAKRRKTAWSFTGPTIAAAMAAAGFAERKPDKYARQRDQLSRWVAECQRGEGDFFSMTAPQSRQRPRKGVRLGRRGRRLALGAELSPETHAKALKRLANTPVTTDLVDVLQAQQMGLL